MNITVLESHIVIVSVVAANATATFLGIRNLRHKLNGHLDRHHKPPPRREDEP